MPTADKDPEELHVQLDYHLCHTEHKSSTWRQALGEHHFRAENIADLIEFIYFLWFEARQLSRAAHMLAKVCCCHAATMIPGVPSEFAHLYSNTLLKLWVQPVYGKPTIRAEGLPPVLPWTPSD